MTPYSFNAGFARSAGKALVLGTIDQIVALGSPATSVFVWDPGRARWSTWTLDWTATRLWVNPALQLFLMGPQGLVFYSAKAIGGGISTETIDPTGKGAERSGDFLDLRQLGERMYACGMSRQVYRREGDNLWKRVDAGTVQPAGSLEVAGFTSLDGMDDTDFYAVGFGGEIWRCHKGAWAQMDSPTNVVLNCVRAIAPDRLYACGQNGVLLRGTGNRWSVIDDATIDDDLWSIQVFNEAIYVASESALYKLGKNDVPREIGTGLGDGYTYRHLHANDGVMWSFGGKNVAWTANAKKWNDVTP